MKNPSAYESPKVVWTESADGRTEQSDGINTVPASGADYVPPVVPPPPFWGDSIGHFWSKTAQALTSVEYVLEYTEGVTIDVGAEYIFTQRWCRSIIMTDNAMLLIMITINLDSHMENYTHMIGADSSSIVDYPANVQKITGLNDQNYFVNEMGADFIPYRGIGWRDENWRRPNLKVLLFQRLLRGFCSTRLC